MSSDRAPVLALRAESGTSTGAGHLARVVALAEGWVQRKGSAVIAADVVPPIWLDRIRVARVDLTDARDLPARAEWYVLDGYGFGPGDRRTAARRGRLLVIDDFGEMGDGSDATLVLDQNAGADPAKYVAPVLAGPRFALLRRSLRETPVRAVGPVRRLLVGLGGFPSESTQAFAREVVALVDDQWGVFWLDGTVDPADGLRTADIAMAMAGSFTWELCRFGVPAVLLSTAPNQRRVAEAVSRTGAAIDGGAIAAGRETAVAALLRSLAGDVGRRSEMAALAQQVVDGRGTDRVVTRLRSELVELRPARQEDASRLLQWANDEGTRAASFHSEPIDRATHDAWLARRIADPKALQWVAYAGADPIGLVRFDPANADRTEIGVTIAPARRGEGWAAAVIDRGCRTLRPRQRMHVVARIKAGNSASIAAFEQADFTPGTAGVEGVVEYSRVVDAGS